MDGSFLQRVLSKHRHGLFALVLSLAGAGLYLKALDSHYPVSGWLVWDLITLWAWCAAFTLGCLGMGLRSLRWLGVSPENLLERSVLGMASGVTVFGFAMYLLGAFGGFQPAGALLLTITLGVIGGRDLVDLGSASLRSFQGSEKPTVTGRLARVFGGLCLVAIYLSILTPDALNYDATWAHVVIAEDYAREGYLAPFWASYTRNVPHLASLVYTWAYLVPSLDVPMRWMLVLHLEFSLFLWTLVGISASVRWLLKGGSASGTWAAFFLFPLVFVYDSNLGGAADHVLAFFAMPLLLTLRSALRDFAPGPCYLLAILAGGAALTKYQAVYLLLPLVPALTARWLGLLRAELGARRSALRERSTGLALLLSTPLIMFGLFLLVFAPHLAKNYYYHANPVYPFLSEVFTGSTPWVPNGAFYVEHIFKDQRWVPQGGLLERLTHAARLFFTFSFTPHYSFTREWPIFGPLFTLLLPALVIVRERRILLAAGTACIALFMWAYTFNVDRNLQIFLPFLVCVTAALLARLWSKGWFARIGVSALVALQVTAGADVIFYTAQPNLHSSMRLITSGFEGRSSARYADFRALHRAIGNSLPADARLLLHTHHPSLGINREVIFDWTGYQGLVSYAHVSTVRDLVANYQSLGISHVLYVPGEWQAPSRKEEVLFHRFALDYARSVASFGPYRLLPVPSDLPPPRPPMRVVTLGMPGYANGEYSVDQMNVNEYLPAEWRSYPPPKRTGASEAELDSILRGADAVFVAVTHNQTPRQTSALRNFQHANGYAGLFNLYLKRTPGFIGSPPSPGGGTSVAAPAGARNAPAR